MEESLLIGQQPRPQSGRAGMLVTSNLASASPETQSSNCIGRLTCTRDICAHSGADSRVAFGAGDVDLSLSEPRFREDAIAMFAVNLRNYCAGAAAPGSRYRPHVPPDVEAIGRLRALLLRPGP